MAVHTHTVDKKGRVIVPAVMRENMGNKLIVTRNIDPGYLSMYSEEHFEKIKEQILGLSGTDEGVRRIQRFIVGEAVTCGHDSQGRILIKQNLWDAIGVKPGEDICFIDMSAKVDICSAKQYQEAQSQDNIKDELDLSQYNVSGL